MMEAARISETSVDIQLRTRQYIPEDTELHGDDLFTLLRTEIITAVFHSSETDPHLPTNISYINPLKPKSFRIIFKYLVYTAKKTQHFTIIRTRWLMFCK
jgi:hypothetical protein